MMKKRVSLICAVLAVLIMMTMTLSACFSEAHVETQDRSAGNWLEGDYVLTGMMEGDTDYSASLGLLDEQTLYIDEDNYGRGKLSDVDLKLQFDPYSDSVDDGTGVEASYSVDGDQLTIYQGDYTLVYTKK